MSRRAALGLAAGAGLVVASPGLASAAAVTPTRLPIPSRSVYRLGLGSTFTAVAGAKRYSITLSEILDVHPAALRASAAQLDQSFNLIFRPVGLGTVPAGIYRIGSSRVPEADLYLSPVDKAPVDRAGRPRLQALVNRSGQT